MTSGQELFARKEDVRYQFSTLVWKHLVARVCLTRGIIYILMSASFVHDPLTIRDILRKLLKNRHFTGTWANNTPFSMVWRNQNRSF